MKDYIDQIEKKEEAPSVAQEPAFARNVDPTWTNADRHRNPFTLSEASMPCFFSEEELDEEIRVSMKSGNATQCEVDAVFCR